MQIPEAVLRGQLQMIRITQKKGLEISKGEKNEWKNYIKSY